MDWLHLKFIAIVIVCTIAIVFLLVLADSKDTNKLRTEANSCEQKGGVAVRFGRRMPGGRPGTSHTVYTKVLCFKKDVLID